MRGRPGAGRPGSGPDAAGRRPPAGERPGTARRRDGWHGADSTGSVRTERRPPRAAGAVPRPGTAARDVPGGARRPRPPGPRGRAASPARRPLRRSSSIRRLNAALLSIAFAVTLVVGRLVQLQGVDGAQYRTAAQHYRMQVIPIPAVRGEIVSADGVALAMTVQTDLVYADPPFVRESLPLPRAARELAGPLRMRPSAVLWLLRHPSSPDYVVLKQSVDVTSADAIAGLGITGVVLQPSYTRSYPQGDLAAPLLGFTDTSASGVMTGEAGLEQAYNRLLAGRNGTEVYEMGSNSEPIPGTVSVIRRAVPAGGLRLTIQSYIQWEAERACAAQVRATKALNCSVVVMQPSTGRILALAQYPTFNPNEPVPSLAATTDIPVSEIFAPGSTAKVITVAAAFEHGGQSPASSYVVPAALWWHGALYHDAEAHPTLRYTIAGIIANSLNDGMVQVADHVTPAQQYAMFRAFGIGSATPLGLPAEQAGLLPPPSQWTGAYRNERYMISFGQGVAVTAVQMASVYATIADGGVRVTPTVVAGRMTPAGRYVPARPPARRRVISRKVAAEIMSMLEQVPLAYARVGETWGLIPGYTVAAKTGTSQEPGSAYGLHGSIYGASFIGIAPASADGLVVAVNVQDPRKGSYFGIDVAGPVFHAVMKFALASMKIPPDGDHVPRVPLTVP